MKTLHVLLNIRNALYLLFDRTFFFFFFFGKIKIYWVQSISGEKNGGDLGHIMYRHWSQFSTLNLKSIWKWIITCKWIILLKKSTSVSPEHRSFSELRFDNCGSFNTISLSKSTHSWNHNHPFQKETMLISLNWMMTKFNSED